MKSAHTHRHATVKNRDSAQFDPPRAGGYPGNWIGRFIWDHGESIPFHYFLMCRKTFELPIAPQHARIHLAVADKYILYVNGEYIGRGPCRSAGPDWTCFDTRELSGRLRKGKNVIAILAYYYGFSNNFSHDQRAGLFAQAEMILPDGTRQVTASDDTWKVRHASAWRRDVSTVCVHQGIQTEVYEAGRDPEDWINPSYDDSAWENAFVTNHAHRFVDTSHRSSWSYLEPRITPLLDERDVAPVRLVAVGETIPPAENAFSDTQVPERLEAESHRPLTACRADKAESFITGKKTAATFSSAGANDPFIVLDFGRPLMAMPRLTFEAASGAVIETVYSDHLVKGRVPPTQPGTMRYGDRYVAREGLQTWQPFEVKTATRYLQLVFRTGGAPLKLRSVNLVSQEYPVKWRGSFACSDKTLTRLWKIGVNTTHLHLEDCFVFEPVRERTPYALMGEVEQQHLAYYAAFGDIAATDYNFLYSIRHQSAAGTMPCYEGYQMPNGFPEPSRRLPALPFSVSTNSLPPEGVFYPQAVFNRHLYFAKAGFLEEQYPSLVRLAGWFERQTDPETGMLNNVQPLFFLDWPLYVKWDAISDLNGMNFGLNALYCKMLDDLASIASILKQRTHADRWRKQARALRQQLRRTHWNEARGLYVDMLLDGAPVETYSEHINGMALLYNIATPAQVPRILQELRNRKPDITRVSPLSFHYFLEALISAGADEDAFRYMSESYRPLVDSSDFPTLSEQWLGKDVVVADNESGIHGGGAGVVWTLSMHVLGIKPVTPGFTEVIFDPRPGNLKWAKGVLPTPHGDIHVEWKRDSSSKIIPKIKLPLGIKLVKKAKRSKS